MTHDLTFPPLAEPYHTALRAAAAYIVERFDPLGLIASGTIIRGNPGPSSDLDLYVIHAPPWRQRLQRWFEGVPAEIFINPPPMIRRYFDEERAEMRPITAHMIGTGFVILDRDPVIETLRAEAREQLATPPIPSAGQLRWRRYLIASQYEDARDVATSDPPAARMILAQAVHGMLQYAFRQSNRFVPREKDLLRFLDEPLAGLAQQFFGAADLDTALALAGQIADRTIQAHGFFEWESEPEPIPPAA